MFDLMIKWSKRYYKVGQLFCITKPIKQHYIKGQVLQSSLTIAKKGSAIYLAIDNLTLGSPEKLTFYYSYK